MNVEADHRRVFVDKQSPDVFRALLQTAKAARAAATEAGLDPRLIELVNLRVSAINGCAYCLDQHTRDALKLGETAQRLATLPAWRGTDLFSPTEQAALVLAESVTTLPSAEDQARDYALARQQLSADQISAVIWVAITMNSFNRVSILSRHPVRPQEKVAAGAS
jgi:AhpD family alkylhydroperoxidase